MEASDEKTGSGAVQIAKNKRYAAAGDKGFTVADAARNVKEAVGNIDVLVHSLANGPEVAKPLLETSRKVHCYCSSPISRRWQKLLLFLACIQETPTAKDLKTVLIP